MKSRFCYPSNINSTFYYPSSGKIQGNFNFTVNFWQPFIDVEMHKEVAMLCGSLLGVFIEFANKMHLR